MSLNEIMYSSTKGSFRVRSVNGLAASLCLATFCLGWTTRLFSSETRTVGTLTQSSRPVVSSNAANVGSDSSQTVNFNGRTIHYVIDGTGPVVILLHGFPQDSHEFHTMMPRLAKQFTVVAPDLRGIRGSTRPSPNDPAYVGGGGQ